MNAALLDPMRGLGYTFAATGRHAAAAALLDRALLVSRRNHGLFDISQQGVLRQLATSLTKLGRAPEAERHMNYLLRVAEQDLWRRQSAAGADSVPGRRLVLRRRGVRPGA